MLIGPKSKQPRVRWLDRPPGLHSASAGMAEQADALALGASGASPVSSTPRAGARPVPRNLH